MKRISMLIMSLVVLLSISTHASAAKKDELTGNKYEKEMRALIKKGIIDSSLNNTYKPNNPITRAEFAKYIVKTLQLEKGTMTSEDEVGTSFIDVDPDDDYRIYINLAVSAGIMSGDSKSQFKPKKTITREEMAFMVDQALKVKGIYAKKAKLTYSDHKKINASYVESVQRLSTLKIMKANKNNRFDPKLIMTKGHTANVLYLMLNVLDPPKGYSIATITKNGVINKINHYKSFADARKKVSSKQIILKGNQIVWMEKGIAAANSYTVVYKEKTLKTSKTYVSAGTELKFFEAEDGWSKIQAGDMKGYVSTSKLNLIPNVLNTERSYYQNVQGNLVHYIYNPLTKSTISYIYGSAPAFLKAGTKYYSWNGSRFETKSGKLVGEAYQYFNRVPLYTKTQYSAKKLDQFIKAKNPKSPFVGLGSAFKEAEKKYNINALYFMSHAILESGWGSSAIAKDKHNLFGLGAIDSSPYESAKKFKNYKSGILEAANKYVVPGYFDQASWKYSGAFLGNKGMGMNVRYASDPYWGQKIAGLMYQADLYLSQKYNMKKERNKYSLAISTTPNVNVRKNPTVPKLLSNNRLYSIMQKGDIVQIKKSVKTTKGVWYQIQPQNIKGKKYKSAYVYSHGYKAYGTSFKLLPLSK
ncbi:S-layer homology domain-containing protein [Heyndrickxia sporothermodurans]